MPQASKCDSKPRQNISSTKVTPPTKILQLLPNHNHAIMADEATSSAPTEALANLHLDEVTGEKVSKSELKKRQKQRQKEEEKKKREAAAPPKPVAAKKPNAEADEKELNPNVNISNRTSSLI